MATHVPFPAPEQIDDFPSSTTAPRSLPILRRTMGLAVPVLLDLSCIAIACVVAIVLYKLQTPTYDRSAASLWTELSLKHGSGVRNSRPRASSLHTARHAPPGSGHSTRSKRFCLQPRASFSRYLPYQVWYPALDDDRVLGSCDAAAGCAKIHNQQTHTPLVGTCLSGAQGAHLWHQSGGLGASSHTCSTLPTLGRIPVGFLDVSGIGKIAALSTATTTISRSTPRLFPNRFLNHFFAP